MRAHAHLGGPLEDVTTAEEQISTAIAYVLSGISIAGSNRILELAQLKVIAAKKGQSVVVYIWCETVEELFRLYELLTSGHLRECVEQLFNQLLTWSQKVAVKDVKMNDDEFKRIKECFRGDELFLFKFTLLGACKII